MGIGRFAGHRKTVIMSKSRLVKSERSFEIVTAELNRKN